MNHATYAKRTIPPNRKTNRIVRRSPEALDLSPQIDERQTRAFDLSIQGFSYRAIASLLGIDRVTVKSDVLFEAERRSAERKASRDAMIEKSVSRYERHISESTLRANEMKQNAQRAANWKERTASEAALQREVGIQLKAQRQSEDVQGLHVPIKIDASTTNNNTLVLGDPLMDAFDALSPEMRAQLHEEAHRQREAEARALKNVTP